MGNGGTRRMELEGGGSGIRKGLERSARLVGGCRRFQACPSPTPRLRAPGLGC